MWLRLLAMVTTLTVALQGVGAQVITPSEISKLPYDHPVIVDLVVGPSEANSIEEYARIVWIDPLTHDRHVRDTVNVKIPNSMLIHVVAASPHRSANCTLSVTLDDRKVLERTLQIPANGIVQESVQVEVAPGFHVLSAELTSGTRVDDAVHCDVRVESDTSNGDRRSVPGLVIWPVRLGRRRRW